MDNYRAILAIVLAFFILLGYQYIFVTPQEEQPAVEKVVETQTPQVAVQRQEPAPAPATPAVTDEPARFAEPVNLPEKQGREIVVETNTFRTVISETGGGIKSFKLKEYRETPDADAP
ncbi:MAG: membrane protein insertase YidC, partial [Deltaproteobacteria bacterium]|nr:membrane protein insertase YidC [Deltaproteobacteria bacterium]